jgi:hypothetical protein
VTNAAPREARPAERRALLANPLVVFGFLNLLIGLLWVVATPPFEVPDEPAHFFRAWAISTGQVSVPQGDGVFGAWIPSDVVATVETLLRRSERRLGQPPPADSAIPPNSPRGRLIFLTARSTAPKRAAAFTAPSYTPVGYIPAVVAIAASRAAGGSTLTSLYAVRFANLAAASLLILAALRIAPMGRWTIALCAMLPMQLFIRTSASIDALLDATAIVVIAIALRAMSGIEPKRGIDVLGAGGSVLLLMLIKPGFLFLPWAALCRPRAQWRNAVARIAAATVLIAAVSGTALSLAWASRNAPPTNTDIGQRAREALLQPVDTLGTLETELTQKGPFWAAEMIGNLGWLDIPLPRWLVIALGGVLVLVALVDGPAGITMARNWRLASIAAAMAAIASILVIVYLAATARDPLHAVQGRYFLPALPLLLVALGSARLRREASDLGLGLTVAAAAIAGNAFAVWVAVNSYAL